MADDRKRTLTDDSNTLELLLDKDQVFLKDPGQGTPAMVTKRIGLAVYSSTFWCAQGTGNLEPHNPRNAVYELTRAEMQWLDEQEDDLQEFLYPPEENA